MIKRAISFLLCVIMMLPCAATVCADLVFSDVPENYWASGDIYALVQAGIINGYEDGTFRPEVKVNRAEFAKLVGAGTEPNTEPFNDVPESFWGYKYIMDSAIDYGNEKFYPEEYMKRGDICEILYIRHGNGIRTEVPAVITKGNFDKYAVAWAYSTGLMIGDDGINLRLDDSVTRAEAVTLIQRAKNIDNSNLKTIYDTADEKTLEYLFNGVDIFDSKYNTDTEFTHGELAQAAMRLAYTHQIPDEVYSVDPGFENKYAYDLAVLCSKVWGTDKCTESFLNEKANMQETLSALMFGYFAKNKGASVKISTEGNYGDFTDNGTSMQRMLLSTAKTNGIVIKESDLDAKRNATFKDVAIMLLQINDITGLEYVYNGEYIDSKISVDITEVSESVLDDYAVFLKDVPVSVYETEMEAKSTCKEATRFIRSYKSVFNYVMDSVKNQATKKGYDVSISFYPSMVAHSENGFIARIKLVPATDVMLSEIFVNSADTWLKAGNVYYIDIDTCADVADMLSEIPDIKVVKVLE